jgi:hypothetical protein
VARRSKSKSGGGGFGSRPKGKPRPQPQPLSEAQIAFEKVLDAVSDAVRSNDDERMRAVMELLAPPPPFAADAIVRRLIEDREESPGVMLMILSRIAGDRRDVYFERIVKDRDAPDLVRFEAQGILGWEGPRESQRRAGFLRKLRDGYGALATSVNLIGRNWPGRAEPLIDTLDYLMALDHSERDAALERIISDAGWNAIPFLHGLLHVEDEQIQARTIAALAEYRFSGSVGPLRRVAATTTNADARRRATDALENVAFDRHAAPDPDQAAFPGADPRPLVWAKMTRVEPGGGQSIWVVRESFGGLVDETNFYIDGQGLRECNQFPSMTRDEIDDELLAIEGEDAALTTVDLAIARGAVQLAVDIHAATTRPLPFEFELYAPLLHESYPPAPGEPVRLPILDDAPFAGRDDLVAESGRLLEHPFFNDWFFTFDAIIDAMRTLPFDSQPDSGDAWTIERGLLNPDRRTVLRNALRRQAWLLAESGSHEESQLALALAAWLPGAPDDALDRNVFLHTVSRNSLRLIGDLLVRSGLPTDKIDGWDEFFASIEDESPPDDLDVIEAAWSEPAGDARDGSAD